MKYDGVSVISPMWGDRKITDRMVFSVIHQYIAKENPIKIELILVDDYIEARGPNNESPYDYYVSDEFKKLYDTKHIEVKLIKNKTHKYQGNSREIGYSTCKYPWFILIDCDDVMTPNACDRYLCLLNQYETDRKHEVNQRIIDAYTSSMDPKELEGKEMDVIFSEAKKWLDKQPKYMKDNITRRTNVACIYGLTYGFSTHLSENIIEGHSIWVQGRMYNKDFIRNNDIHFPRGLHSRQAEDYPFIRTLDYAISHDPNYEAIKMPYGVGGDCQATVYWYPNDDSLSRRDTFYGQHLAGWTMASSNSILDYMDKYNQKHNIVWQEDEHFKHDLLNMTVYAWYNLLDFIRCVSSPHPYTGEIYVPIEIDWKELVRNVYRLRDRLKSVYWSEIVPSDVEDMLYSIHHHSDCRFCESWEGTFYDWMDRDYKDHHGNYWEDMTYDQMMAYCADLEFDAVGHEIHAWYVKAWEIRHKEENKDGQK